jgi:hypothetical protein
VRLAWLRPAPLDPANPIDDTSALIDAMRARHTIDTFDERRAHDLVWMRLRQPFDVCIYELDDTAAHRYVWPYLLRFPGIVLLRSASLNRSRAAALRHEQQRDAEARERTFSGWPMLRAPLLASRLVAVPHESVAENLRNDYPEARIRHLPVGVPASGMSPLPPGDRTRFGFIHNGDDRQVGILERAAQRARAGGAPVALIVDRDARRVFHASDVVLALHWPSEGHPLVDAVATMAARRVPVVFDTLETADWPSLDPQTWQPRGPALRGRPFDAAQGRPICVSIDLRDEEHSLMLAMRRLAADEELRRKTADAAWAWWRTEATVERTTTAFEALLEEALSLPPPQRPADWPPHLTADGTEGAREILAEIGVTVDFLR